MLLVILKAISEILDDGLGESEGKDPGPGPKPVPRVYVKNAKSLLDNLIKEYEKKPIEIPKPPVELSPVEAGLDDEAQAAQRDLMGA
jgi:hypothetical protein